MLGYKYILVGVYIYTFIMLTLQRVIEGLASFLAKLPFLGMMVFFMVFCVTFCAVLLSCAMVYGHECEGNTELFDDAPHESSFECFTRSGPSACTSSRARTTWHAII